MNFTVERIGENSKFFGFGIVQHAKFTILDVNREIDYIDTSHSFVIKYNVAGSTYIKTNPTFYITQTRRDENTNTLTVYGYDLLYPAASQHVSELTFPDNPRLLDYMLACIKKLGTSTPMYYGFAASDPLLSMRYPEGANYEGSETIREMLDDFAEATQTIYYVNHQNQVCWKRLKNPDITDLDIMDLTKDRYFTLTTKDGRRLQSICSATQLGENIIFSGTEIGSTQYVRDNGFWDMREDITTLVENAVAAIGGLSIRQFDCSWRGYLLVEPGDRLDLTTKDDDIVISYLLDDVITYDGSLSQHTKWSYTDNEVESLDNPTSLGDALKQTYAKVDKVNKQIELVASDIRSEMDERFASLEINPDGILAEVSRLEQKIDDGLQSTRDDFDSSIGNVANKFDNEITKINQETASLKLKADGIEASVSQIDSEIAGVAAAVNAKVSAEDVEISIQKAMEQGVEAITTTTGFTFNEEGLHVNKTGSDITTTITEDGMTVLRKGDAVLTADNLGVRAEDLHATTFLIIGNNSRLEDYEGNRTGCFWIGN